MMRVYLLLAMVAGVFLMLVKENLNPPLYRLILMIVAVVVILLANWIAGHKSNSINKS